jgi:hypothetical protein
MVQKQARAGDSLRGVVCVCCRAMQSIKPFAQWGLRSELIALASAAGVPLMGTIPKPAERLGPEPAIRVWPGC